MVNGFTIDFTVGEIAASPVFSVYSFISPGFQQPMNVSNATGAKNTAWLSGEVSEQAIQLKWVTPKENNSDKFIVEKGKDTLNSFQPVATTTTLAPNGFSNSPTQYNWTEKNNTRNISYYRIKLIDKKGNISFSNTIALVDSRLPWRLENIYPNPVSSLCNLQIFTKEPAKATAVIIDFFGRNFLTRELSLQKGMNNLPLTLSNLPQGAYFLRIQCTSDNRNELMGKILKIE